MTPATSPAAPDPAESGGPAGGPSAASLDRQDLAILRLLATDGRMSQRRIARAVGMSPPGVADRIARMERAGVIRGYRAEIDRSRLGYGLVVYVGVVAIQGADQPAVVRRLRSMSEVEDVHVVTGPKDLLVRLRVRDHEHLREVLFDRLWGIEGIDRTETYISLGQMEPKNVDVAVLDLMGAPRSELGGPEHV